jgi:hypothetical protein
VPDLGPKRGVRAGSWPQAWDPVTLLRARRGGRVGGDPVVPGIGALDPQRRPLQQPFRPLSADLGGRAWGGKAWLPPLPCTAMVLLLLPLLAGRGGKELREASSDASGFCVFQGFPSTQVLRRGAWWSSSQQTVGLPWGRQTVLPLEMAPPFNNKQRLFRLILDGVPSVFLLASRGGGGEEASEVLRLGSARSKVGPAARACAVISSARVLL